MRLLFRLFQIVVVVALLGGGVYLYNTMGSAALTARFRETDAIDWLLNRIVERTGRTTSFNSLLDDIAGGCRVGEVRNGYAPKEFPRTLPFGERFTAFLNGIECRTYGKEKPFRVLVERTTELTFRRAVHEPLELRLEKGSLSLEGEDMELRYSTPWVSLRLRASKQVQINFFEDERVSSIVVSKGQVDMEGTRTGAGYQVGRPVGIFTGQSGSLNFEGKPVAGADKHLTLYPVGLR